MGTFSSSEYCLDNSDEATLATNAEAKLAESIQGIADEGAALDHIVVELGLITADDFDAYTAANLTTAIEAMNAAISYYEQIQTLQSADGTLITSYEQYAGLISGMENAFTLASAMLGLVGLVATGPAGASIAIAAASLGTTATVIGEISSGLKHTLGELRVAFPEETDGCAEEEEDEDSEGTSHGGVDVLDRIPGSEANDGYARLREDDGAFNNDLEDSQGGGGFSPLDWLRSLFDPFVLDLDGDGAELTAIGEPEVFFDYEGDAIRQLTGWVDPDDGILVRDLDGNGQVETLNELFGNATTDAYTDLATQDSSGDGVIDQSDEVWSDLRVWRDLDQDGETDEGELSGMSDAGVLSISLARDDVHEDRDGNVVVAEGSYTTTIGDEREAIAAFLQTDETRTRAVLPDDFQFDPVVFDLPNLIGTGSQVDLHIAMTMDPALLAKAQALAAQSPTMTGADFKEGFEALVSAWAGISRADFATDGDFERAITQAFLGDGAPVAQWDTVQTASFDAVMDSLQLRFAAQIGMLAVANAETPEESAAALEHPFFALSAFIIDPETGELSGSLAHAVNMATAFLPRDDRNAAIEQIEKTMPMLNALRDEGFGETFSRTFGSSDYERGVWSVLNATMNDPLIAMIAHNYATAAAIETGSDGDDTISVFHDDYTVEFNRDISVVDGGKGDDAISHVQESELFAPQRALNTSVASYIFRSGDGDDIVDLTGAGHFTHTVYLPDIAREDAVICAGEDGESAVIAFSGGGSIAFQGIANDAVQIRFIFEDGRIITGDELIAVSGGADNNVIDGTSADENFDGGAGDDVISGGDGSDTYHFFAGGGHDEIIEDANAPGSDVLWMRDALIDEVSVTFSGSDVVIEAAEGDSVTLIDQIAPAVLFGGIAPRVETVRFADGVEINTAGLQDLAFLRLVTDGNDTIGGTNIGERLFLSAGDDTLSGQGGGDTYVREAGTSGSDRIEDGGGSVGDRLVLHGVSRGDVTFFRDGADVVLTFADGSTTTLVDQMALGALSAIEEIEFGDGEAISGSELAALVNGVSGGDAVINGSDSGETLVGGAEAETFDGHGGDDRLEGAAGSDLYIRRAGDGDDVIADTGGSSLIETDRVSFEGLTESDVAFRRMESGDLEIETLATGEVLTIEGQFLGSSTTGIEAFLFSDGARLSATEVADRAPISGRDGDDTLTGTADDDVFVGGLGDDDMSGDAGSDTYIVCAGDGHDMIHDVAGDDEVNLLRLEGIAPADISIERLTDPVHDDAVIRIGESQTVRIAGQFSQTDNDRGIQKIVFDDGTEIARDVIKAMAHVVGTDGDELLRGSTEDDVLIGRAGDDTLSGLAGNDIYRWGAGDGNDVVLDDAAADARTINAAGFVGLNREDITFARSGDDLVATIATGETLTLHNQFRGSLSGSVMGVGAVVFADGETLSRAELVELFPITGSDASEELDGGFGDDALLAGLGDDAVDGGRGADIVFWRKGDGNDTVYDSGSLSSETDTLKLVDVSSAEIAFVRGGLFYNDLDIVIRESGERIKLGDHFGGGSGIERIVFSDGEAIETAEIANAPYVGTDAGDYIEAGAQDDILIGGLGADDLFGGAGADTYIHAPGDGNDVINESFEEPFDGPIEGSEFEDPDLPDFTPTVTPHNSAGDSLDLSGFSLSAASFSRSPNSGNDLVIAFAADGTNLTVVNQFAGPLSGIEHFIFEDGEIGAVDVASLVTPRDTLGTEVADELVGDFLDQTFTPGGGDDLIVTGGGRDSIVIEPSGGTDRIEGFQGGPFGTMFVLDPSTFADFDALLAAASHTGDDVTIDLGSGDAVILTAARLSDLAPENFGFGPEPITGTEDDETVTGTTSSDVIDSKGGNDIVDARAGDDTVDAGAGDDLIRHAAGDGNDVYDGGAGRDTLQISGGDAILDLASGTALIGGDAVTFLDIESVALGSGDDQAIGDGENNTIRLGDGTDEADGGAGADILDGEGGDDRLMGGAGNDAIIGGDGNDSAVFSGVRSDYSVRETGASIEVEDLRSGTPDGLDMLHGIESLVFADQSVSVDDALQEPELPVIEGSEDGERLRGTNEAEQIRGLGGDDRLIGRGGDDVLEGGAGDDVLNGGAGDDSMAGGAGNDVYVVDSIGDTILEAAESGVDKLRASVTATLGDNVENLRLTGSNAIDGTGNALANKIVGNDAANTLAGDAGDDRVVGRGGNDLLDGGAGADILRGGDGDDVLKGGSGADRLLGGDGADTFIFSDSDGAARDIIRDFEVGIDMIGLSGMSVTDVAARGNHALVSFDNGGDILLRGVEASELDLNDDFLFV